jgi:hypothetical protein
MWIRGGKKIGAETEQAKQQDQKKKPDGVSRSSLLRVIAVRKLSFWLYSRMG